MSLLMSWFQRLVVVSVLLFDDGGDTPPPWPPK